MEDATAVLNAAGSSTAALLGVSEGGPTAMLFAAAHPERTRALILCGVEVRERKDGDWPWGESTPEEFEEAMASLPGRARGTPHCIDVVCGVWKCPITKCPREDQVCHVENARFLARTIPGAKYLEIDAVDHVPWGDGADRIVPEIQEFLGQRGGQAADLRRVAGTAGGRRGRRADTNHRHVRVDRADVRARLAGDHRHHG
jgi:pimeloyl-ACP methyl ester carboxylesterase